MNIALELIFIALVIADTVLTYMAIESGKAREIAFAKLYIKNVPLTVAITIAGAGILMLFLAAVDAVWFLIFPIGAFGYACWKNYKVLNG